MTNQCFEIPFETPEEKDALDFIERRQGDLSKSSSLDLLEKVNQDLNKHVIPPTGDCRGILVMVEYE